MAHFLVYWETFRDFGSDSARDLVQTKGYGSPNLASVNPGDIVWAVVRDSTSPDKWKIAQQIYVVRLDREESETSTRYRAVADPDKSRFFEMMGQPNAEAVLTRLSFRSGKKITASGPLIGRQIQSVRSLSPDDSKLLEDHCSAFSADLRNNLDDDLESRRRRVVELDLLFRNADFVKRIKALYRDHCQVCGTTIALPGGGHYSEVHHIRPLGDPHKGPDDCGNMLCVCPNCHVRLDYGVIRLDTHALTLDPAHKLLERHVTYHNESIYSER